MRYRNGCPLADSRARLRWRDDFHHRRDSARAGGIDIRRSPWIPRINFHNPVLAYETGDDFLAAFYSAAEGELSPFILVVEGSVPNENNKPQGYWASFGTDRTTGQPIPTCDWIDWLAPHAWAVVAAGTCAAYGGIHAMQGNPTGAMGLPDYLGWQWKSSADTHRLHSRLSRTT